MADKAINYVFEKVTFLIEREAKLLAGFSGELKSFRKQLVSWKGVLQVYDDQIEDRDKRLRDSIGELREAAYVAAEFINDLQFRIGSGDQYGHGFIGSVTRTVHSLNLYKCHKMASELQLIKADLQTAVDGVKEIQKQINARFGPGSSSVNNAKEDHAKYIPPGERATLLNCEDSIVGFEEPKKHIVSELVDGYNDQSQLKVISIQGMGGLGKTTLAKIVSEDVEVKKHFQVIEIFIINESFNIDEFLKDMLHRLCDADKMEIPREVNAMNRQSLVAMIKTLLSRMSYLLVLDNVRTIQAWENMGECVLPKKSKGRVLLTTRYQDVAKAASSKRFNGHLYELGFLSPEHSFKLLCKMVFNKDSCPPELTKICEEIVKKCGQLPLAIRTVGGLLSRTSRDEWEIIRDNLEDRIHDDKALRECLTEVLDLTSLHLDYYVGQCYLYLSIFPEDHPIDYNRLVRLFVAEGFVKDKQGMTLEQVAAEYLKELLNLSLLQVAETTSDGRVKMVRVHSILREIITPIAERRNQAVVAKLSPSSSQNTQLDRKCRRLSIQISIKNVPPKGNLSRLRSLLMFKVEQSSISTFLRSRKFRMLNVLDLQDAPLDKFPEVVVHLFQLSYLSLRKTKVKEIPKSIEKLINLQTLDLKDTNVSKLPDGIRKLKKLRHLFVYRYDVVSLQEFHYKYGFKPPPQIGSLPSLQKLCFLDVSECHDDTVFQDLGKLQELKRLGIVKLKTQQGPALYSAVGLLNKLHALSVTSISEDEIIDLNDHLLDSHHHPLTSLRRLYLTGRLQELPKWIKNLTQLRRLSLKWSKLEEDPVEYLKELPDLIHLELHQACIGHELRFTSGGFKKLKHLGLDKFDNLESINIHKGAIPSLETLVIKRCHELRDLPSGIEHVKLKLLYFVDMPDHFIKKLRHREIDNVHFKIAHVPVVTSTRWNEGGNDWDIEQLQLIAAGTASQQQPSSKPTDPKSYFNWK